MTNSNVNNPRDFYNKISKRYDWFFNSFDDLMERQMKQLIPKLKKCSVMSVLDCSCGTGVQSIGLKKVGFDVVASDLSDQIIIQAKNNAKKYNVNIPFVEADFRYLEDSISDTFDSVICMGNSLPHLMNDDDLLKALNSMYSRLNDRGLLVIEMRDYELLQKNNTRFFPMKINSKVGNELVTITYALDFYEDYVTFNIIYTIDNQETSEKRFEVESVDYNMISSNHLLTLLEKSGYKDINITRNDGQIIFAARKIK